MQLYSKDVNVYVQAKAPLNIESPPAVVKAVGAINKESIPLDSSYADACKKRISESSLKEDYKNALTHFDDMLLLIYQILSAKGGLTKDEWELIKNSITKTKYMFPDMVMEMGTRQPWTIEKGAEEEFIRKLLSAHGFEVKLLPDGNGSPLIEGNIKEFVDQMYQAFGINPIFRDIENAIDKRGKDSGYGKTKKKLYYITLYDFLKFHLGIEGKPAISEVLQAMRDCKDKNSGEIIAVRDSLIPKINGDFWAEYDKYLEFKYIEVLVYWYSVSKVRSLNGKAYDYFLQAVGESVLQKAMQYLKVHTASLDQKRIKVKTQKNTVIYTGFEIHNPGGALFATICLGGYADTFTAAKRTEKIQKYNSLQVAELEFGQTYYISLWEVTGKDDTIKLGDLPTVTPGIQWPIRKDCRKSMVSDILNISLSIDYPDTSMSFVLCLKKGNSFVNSIKDGIQYKPTSDSTSTEIKFKISDLIYEEEYTLCIYVMMQNGKYFNKIQQDIKYTPHKLHLTPITFKPGNTSTSKNELGLEFQNKHWPEEFNNNEICFACRIDRYPESIDDSDDQFIISVLNQISYKDGMFKLRTLKKELKFQTLYICGWINHGSGLVEQVVKNTLFRIKYSIRKNEVTLQQFDTSIHPLPLLRFYIFDKNHNLLYSDENVVFNNNKYIGSWGLVVQIKAKYFQLEASSAEDRLVFEFIYN